MDAGVSSEGLKVGWRKRLAAAFVGGCLVFLAFPRFDIAPLAWVALVPTLWAARGFGLRGRFLIGWFAGTVTNIGGFYWIYGLLQNFGHMSPLPSALLTVLLAAYQGVRFGIAWLLLGILENRIRLFANWWALPLAYLPVEFFFPIIFPWYFANSQHWVIPFIQVVELGGVSLLGGLILAVNGAIFDLVERGMRLRRLEWRLVALVVGIPLVLAVYGVVRMAQVDSVVAGAEKLHVGMVEADVGIWEKEDPRKVDDNLVRHQRLSAGLARKGVDLVVWPETAYLPPRVYARRKGRSSPGWFRLVPRDAARLPPSPVPPPLHAAEDRRRAVPLEHRVAPQRGFSTPLLTGALTYARNPANDSPRHRGIDIFNSAVLLDENGNVTGITDKVYLLLFGEHVPLGHTFPVLYEWFPEAGDLTAGDRLQILRFRNWRLAVMICYEDILPRFTLEVAGQRPHVLVNLTNDAWFGKTAEPYLHLALAVFRTVENRLAMVRSTNTGVSAFIDPVGRVVAQTSLDGAETLDWRVPMMQGRTVYQLLGDWPVWISVAAWLVMVIAAAVRRKTSSGG